MTVTTADLYPLILDSITEGVFTVDSEFRITYFNAEAESITGFSREQALGRKCYEVLKASICQQGCAIRKSLETGKSQRNVRVSVLNPDMEEVPICVSSAVLRDNDGTMIGGVEIFRDVSEVEALRRELSERNSFGEMIGISPAMQRIFQLIPDVAATESSVLIEGASGTGKELIAEAIHDHSPRKEFDFVRVNCGALPDTLLESELFGYEKGAFTDARKSKPGRFQQADKGTLFLDEVGDLSPAFQVKLLRALQEGEIQPLGGTKTFHVDVRVLAATNRPLRQLVGEGKFREDLFYRLCVIPIQVPPLRERRQDILPLTKYHLSRLALRTGKPTKGISEAVLTALHDYDYPGNVRELFNILERAFVLCHEDEIALQHLPSDLQNRIDPATRHYANQIQTDRLNGTYTDRGQSLSGNLPHGPINNHQSVTNFWSVPHKPSEYRLFSLFTEGVNGEVKYLYHPIEQEDMRPEVQQLLRILHAHGWNRGETAAALGISRSTLWRRMKEYGLS